MPRHSRSKKGVDSLAYGAGTAPLDLDGWNKSGHAGVAVDNRDKARGLADAALAPPSFAPPRR